MAEDEALLSLLERLEESLKKPAIISSDHGPKDLADELSMLNLVLDLKSKLAP